MSFYSDVIPLFFFCFLFHQLSSFVSKTTFLWSNGLTTVTPTPFVYRWTSLCWEVSLAVSADISFRAAISASVVAVTRTIMDVNGFRFWDRNNHDINGKGSHFFWCVSCSVIQEDSIISIFQSRNMDFIRWHQMYLGHVLKIFAITQQ